MSDISDPRMRGLPDVPMRRAKAISNLRALRAFAVLF
jgi:hypothetical protein